MLYRNILSLMLIGCLLVTGKAQTCCSGGVPLSGNVGLPSGNKGLLQLSLTYDDNVLKTLKDHRNTLDDDSRTRHTRSLIFQGGYHLTDKWSVDLFSSFVIQERSIDQGVGLQDQTITRGIGDLAVLLKYKWLTLGAEEHTRITSALGVKFPLGASDLTNDLGFTINADLQPGSGAWDGIFWTQATHQLAFKPSSNLSGTFIYNRKGVNDDYLGAFEYQFGDEYQIHLGWGDRFLIAKRFFLDPSIQLQYRHANRDQQSRMDLVNTGGDWLFARLTTQWWLNSFTSLQFGGSIPLYARVDGTQLSPTYRLEAGIYFSIETQKKHNDIIEIK